MAPTSLIGLCAEGKSLKPLDAASIHYPETGAAALAAMERDHFWFTERRRAVLKLLQSARIAPGAGYRGLDIGCGTGYTAVFLTRSGYPTWGVDAHGSFLATDRGGLAAGLIQGDIFSIEPASEFDFILLLDVLEHLPDDRGFLEQSLKFLKPGGVAILSVPAFPWLWSGVDEAAGHHRRYTKKCLGRLFSILSAPVRLERQFYFYGSTLLPFIVSRTGSRGAEAVRLTHEREALPSPIVNKTVKAFLRLELMLSSFGGLPLGSSLIALARKVSPSPAPRPPRSAP